MDTEDPIVLLAAAPATAYREYLYRPHGQLARWIGNRYDVVARPGQCVDRAPQRGDLLIEVVLGRMGGGRYVILDGPELEVMGSRPRLPQGQLILRPLPRVEMSEPMSVEPASEAEDAGLDRLIDQGLSENQITDALFYARHPGQSGATLQAGTPAVREWRGILDTEVRPGVRQRLALSPVDPVQLAVFLSQYENDSRVPAEYTRRFLTGTPLLSMGRTLRDRVIGNWRNAGRPLTALGLFELALETAGDPAIAELLCHNVAKAFAREGIAITWRGTGTEGEYTDGQRTYTAKVINSAGRLKYYHGGRQREVISIFYLLFSAKEFGTDDPGDWYHYFVTATMTALASGGTLGPTAGRGRREDVEGDEEERGGRVGTAMYRGLLSDRVADLEKQMTDPALASVPGYRGWVLANVLSFLEGGHYGADYATGQSDVVRESQVHVRGAAFGLHTIGGSPGKTWRWYVPVAGSLSDADLAMGFNLKNKTAEVWSSNAKPAAGEAADVAFREVYDSSGEAEERLGTSQHHGVGDSPDAEGKLRTGERYDPGELVGGEGLSGYERYGVDELYGADQHEAELFDGQEPTSGSEESPPGDWKQAVFRAIFGGERRINALSKIGRDAGGPSAEAVRQVVVGQLRVPFPHAAQTGGIPCEQHARVRAPARPDLPPASPYLRIFTGRYESVSATGNRYFWAINQAGTAVIAIRTQRGWSKDSTSYLELRGDLQADGTAVLFRADRPEAFWGYLQEQHDRTIRWHDGSYLGPGGSRVFVDGDSNRDEVLQLTANNRPTMMESLFRSPNRQLSVLLQQSEWFPLSPGQLRFIETSVSSHVLRQRIGDYLATPEGVTQAEKQAKDKAAAWLVNYISNLLWDGDPATRPTPRSSLWAALPYGHHNNAQLAAHVAKIWLAYFKLDHEGATLSYLDWLTELIQHRNLGSLSKMLDIPIDPTRAKGTYQYRLTLEVVSAGIVYAEGTLRVEKLTAPRWPGGGSLNYNFGAVALGKPRLPSRDQVFDLVVTIPQEWMPDDFEGTLWLTTVTASAGAGPAQGGAKVTGGFLRSHNGMSIALEAGDVFLEPGTPQGKKDKPKITLKAEGLVGPVSRSGTGRLDLSRPFVASAAVIGNLTTATHFCFDSSLLTPAARQLLRFVCADQLAALDSEASQIFIIGHTDRPGTELKNDELSRLRAENVRTALCDILGPALKVAPDRILWMGLGELVARLKLRPDQLRNPADRRVDVLINGTLVASLKGD